MRAPLSRSFSISLLVAALLLAANSFAQSPLEPAQLPAKTTFYVIWRGTPSGDIRKSNALLSLWDDPDFASSRSAFFESFLTESQKQKDQSKLSREELTQYASLLDNSFVLGYLPRPSSAAPPKSDSAQSATAKSAAPAWNGLFFVYDRSGKEDLLSKAVLRMRAANAEIPKLTPVSVAGVSALKIERKTGTDYWAETGKFAVSANELPVFEEILKRLAGKGDSSNLAQTPAYQEAKPLLAGGALEIFLAIPDLKDLALDTNPQFKPLSGVVKAIKLDSIHVLAGHVSFESSRTRVQGSILGDASPGSLFDIWSDGQANPASFSFFTRDTISINDAQINFLGIYETLKRAFAAGQDTAKTVLPLETLAQARLGMPISDALALTTGEMASFQTSPALDSTKQLFFLGINDKPGALKLLRTILSDQITSEHSEGPVTYLKISLHGSQGSAGLAQWNFYHLAMTPNFLLGAPNAETLHAAVAQQAANIVPSLPQKFFEARKLFPEKINGFSYFDFQKVDWPAMKEKWIADANKAAQVKTPHAASQTTPKQPGWLTSVNPTVFPRHLHSLFGASWKDAHGVHFDEWLE